jgi:Uma2 family endonuclease
VTSQTAPEVALPLQGGDRLSRAEFERRYAAMPGLKKAELIEGVVYMPSPVSTGRHGAPQADILAWLGVYRAHTPGVQCADNATVRLDLDNEPQPDALLRVAGRLGQSEIDADDYVTGAPELVAEIAASSASYDLHDKLNAYRRNGVREYVVWRTLDQAVDWFILREGRYETLVPEGGLYKSVVFPGLWLDAAGLLAGDMRRVLDVALQGTAAPEHEAFVERLRTSG